MSVPDFSDHERRALAGIQAERLVTTDDLVITIENAAVHVDQLIGDLSRAAQHARMVISQLGEMTGSQRRIDQLNQRQDRLLQRPKDGGDFLIDEDEPPAGGA